MSLRGGPKGRRGNLLVQCLKYCAGTNFVPGDSHGRVIYCVIATGNHLLEIALLCSLGMTCVLGDMFNEAINYNLTYYNRFISI